jgi:hypothetical protein
MFIYLNISPSHLALSADVSSQHQKGWSQLQQSGTIILLLLLLLMLRSSQRKFISMLLHTSEVLLQGLPHPAMYGNSAHQAISSSQRSQKFNKSPSVDFTLNHCSPVESTIELSIPQGSLMLVTHIDEIFLQILYCSAAQWFVF